MAQRVGLAAYLITFKEFRKKGATPLVFQRGGGFDPYGLLSGLMNGDVGVLKHYGVGANTKGQYSHAMRINDVKPVLSAAVIRAALQTGQNGVISELVDVGTGRTVHKRKSVEADLLEFHFRLYLPDGKDRALLLLQRMGRYSPRVTVQRYLQEWGQTNDWKVEFGSMHDRVAFEKYLKGGEAVEARLRTYKRPNDNRAVLKQSRLAGRSLLEGDEMEVAVRPKGVRNWLTERAAKVAGGVLKTSDLLTIPGLPDADEALIQVEHPNHGTRTFSFSKLDEAALTVDITDDVDFEADGSPKAASVAKLADKLADELIDRVY